MPGHFDLLAVAIFVAERLLVADEFPSPRAGHGAVLRRLAIRLSGQQVPVTERLLRPGEVLVFREDSPAYQAILPLRLSSAKTVAYIAEGIPPP